MACSGVNFTFTFTLVSFRVVAWAVGLTYGLVSLNGCSRFCRKPAAPSGVQSVVTETTAVWSGLHFLNAEDKSNIAACLYCSLFRGFIPDTNENVTRGEKARIRNVLNENMFNGGK